MNDMIREDKRLTALQKFFVNHREIKISEFAKMVGIDATLLRNYINGFKKPSQAREQSILAGIHALAREYAAADFESQLTQEIWADQGHSGAQGHPRLVSTF